MSRLIHKKRTEAEKNGDKDVKAQYGLMSNAVYGKTMETLRNRIYVKLVSSKKKKKSFKIDIQTKLFARYLKTKLH